MFLFDWFLGILASLCSWLIEAKILFLSLVNSGETTVLHQLKDVVFILFYYLFDWFYGILASLGLWQKEAKILFLGLDNSGKTNVLHRLKDERLVQHQPTQYPISEELSIGKIKFKVFDLGGNRIARRVLKDYYVKVDAVVYVVNALNKKRFAESERELHALLTDESLANVPFLILGNKIDIPEDELGNRMWLDWAMDYLAIAAPSEDELGCLLGLPFFITSELEVLYCYTNVRPDNREEFNGFRNVRPRKVFYRYRHVRPVGVFYGYGDGFKWLSQTIE